MLTHEYHLPFAAIALWAKATIELSVWWMRSIGLAGMGVLLLWLASREGWPPAKPRRGLRFVIAFAWTGPRLDSAAVAFFLIYLLLSIPTATAIRACSARLVGGVGWGCTQSTLSSMTGGISIVGSSSVSVLSRNWSKTALAVGLAAP